MLRPLRALNAPALKISQATLIPLLVYFSNTASHHGCCNPSHPLAVVDYQVSAELSTFMNPVPVFASPSAHGIKFILGSKGQERAKFEFVRVSADFARLFSHVLQHLV